MRRNILQLGSSIDTGGAERVIANLTRYIDRSRFNVWPCHLFSPRGAIGDELVRDGYEVVDVGRNPNGVRRYLSSQLLLQVVRRLRIDVIHTHTHYALADASVCSLATGGKVKVVHTFHYGNYPNLDRRYLMLERVGARLSKRLVAVGIEQEKRVRKALWLRPGKIQVISNGVDSTEPTPDREWFQRLKSTGAVIVGTICTFIEQKGLPDLLQVAAKLRHAGINVVLVVVGDGVLRRQIEEASQSMGLTDRVLFTGWKSRASASMMPLFDVFFQPSRWEAMSMVILEAMAAGKPVVATDVGDNPHVIKHGECGFVVPVNDIAAMTSALTTLATSPDLRARFGSEGRRRHHMNYGVSHMVQQYEQLYQGLGAVGEQTNENQLQPSGRAAGGES